MTNQLYRIIFICLVLLANAFCFADQTIIFSTWEGFEVDKCASIWLIKRFVNNNVKIKFFPKGTKINVGIPFDTPNAKLRRYHSLCTFETVMNAYKLNDPKLKYISKIIHDIEINIWNKKRMKETNEVNSMVQSIITQTNDNKMIIKNSIEYFDSLYQFINSE